MSCKRKIRFFYLYKQFYLSKYANRNERIFPVFLKNVLPLLQKICYWLIKFGFLNAARVRGFSPYTMVIPQGVITHGWVG